MTKAKETANVNRARDTAAESETDSVKFIYRGEEGNTSTDQFGYQFRDEKPVEVSDQRAIEKLRNNPFFEEQGKRKRAKDDEENRPAVLDAGVNPEPHEPTGIIYGGSGT